MSTSNYLVEIFFRTRSALVEFMNTGFMWATIIRVNHSNQFHPFSFAHSCKKQRP